MKKTPQLLGRAILESLEERRMMSSIALVNGLLTIQGDLNTPNVESATRIGSWGVMAYVNGESRVFKYQDVNQVDLNGGAGNDILTVDSSLNLPAVINGYGGSDTISAGAGVTQVHAGKGNDSVNAGAGSEVIYCGIGNDTVTGAATGDTIDGSAGSKNVNGQSITPPTTIGVSPSGGAISNSNGGSTLTPPSGDSSGPSTSTTSAYSTPGSITTFGPTNTSSGTNANTVVSPVITVTAGQTIIAGEATHVQGLATTLGSGTVLDARYLWDFGDPHSEYDELEGFNAAHIYSAPGTYTVTLTVTNDQGSVGAATAQITVLPDNRPVIYVSTSGNDANTGLSPDQAIKTVTHAQQLLSNNTTILFQSGDVFGINQTFSLGSYHDVTVGSYGTGAKPELFWTGARDGSAMVQTQAGAENVVIRGLTFDTIYNQDVLQNAIPMAIVPVGTNIAIVGNTFLNVDYAVNANGSPTGLLVQDNDAPAEYGLRGYFVWIQGSDIVILGNTVANSTQEDLIRGQGTGILVEYNNLTNVQFGAAGTAKSAVALQQGAYAFVAYNTINPGGNVDFGPVSNNSAAAEAGAAETIQWIVVEGNTIDSYLDVQPGTADIRIENNVFENSDIALINVAGAIDTSYYNRTVSDLQIVNNTGIDDGQWGDFMKVFGPVDGIVFDDNIFDAPNIEFGIYDASDIYVSQDDLSSFLQIEGNIWPTSGSSWRTGGVFYVSAQSDDNQAYLSLVSVQALGLATGDTEQNVTFDQEYDQILNGQTIGSTLPVPLAA
jgi:hypothetical protein